MRTFGEPDCDDGPLSFRDRPAPAGTVVRPVTIPPRGELAYEPSEWTGALVIVEAGELELECRDGVRGCFGAGSVLCFEGLGVRAVRNAGRETVQLSSVTRCCQGSAAHPSIPPAGFEPAISCVKGRPGCGWMRFESRDLQRDQALTSLNRTRPDQIATAEASRKLPSQETPSIASY